jgi:Holliday junction resolvase RusA-like endonuclease
MNSFFKEFLHKYNFTSKDLERVKDKFKDIKKRSRIHSIEFFVDHEPKPSKRPRKGKYSFYVPDAGKNKKEIRSLIQSQIPQDFKKINTEIYIDIKCYMPTLEAFSKVDKYLAEKGIIRPITKPDVDNLEKTYLDALNGFVWDDDGLVVDGRTRKYYSVHPRVEIKIKYRNILLSAIFEAYDRKRKEKQGISLPNKGVKKGGRSKR